MRGGKRIFRLKQNNNHRIIGRGDTKQYVYESSEDSGVTWVDARMSKKQIGVFLFSYISVKLGFAQMPNNSNWIQLYGVGILTGIGFTMSLFVGNLAFIENTQYVDGVKLGVLSGSLLSTIAGYFLILSTSRK